MAITRYDLGSEYTGGFPAPTQEEAEAEMLPIATIDSEGDPSLRYAPADEVITADGTLAAALAPLLRGTGLTVTSDLLVVRPRPRSLQLQDFFLSGGLTSGSIGVLGWGLNGVGTPAYTRPNAASLGGTKGQPATSASANDRTSVTLGDTESKGISALDPVKILQCVWSMNNVLTDKRVFFGFMNDFSEEPSAATDALGIYYDSGIVSPANYRLISRASSAGSPVDSGSAVPANTNQLLTLLQPTAGTWQFYIGNSLIGSISSGLPTVTMNIGFRLETLTAATKNLRLGYFGLHGEPGGAFDDDAFLEA